MKSFTSSLAVFALSLLLSPLSRAADYTITDLGAGSVGNGINSSGDVTGQYGGQAFLYNGTMHGLGALGGLGFSTGYGINDSDEVTGQSDTAEGNSRAFLYNGTMLDILGPSIQGDSAGYAINNSGVAVGFYSLPNSAGQAILQFSTGGYGGGSTGIAYGISDNGEVVGAAAVLGHPVGAFAGLTVSPPGVNAISANAVNSNGAAAGVGLVNTHLQAFLYDGTFQYLGTLGGFASWATGINASGQVVGYSTTSPFSGADHAFLYDGLHGMVDINTLINPSSGWVLNKANAINAAGQITGVGTLNGISHGFVLSGADAAPNGYAPVGSHDVAAGTLAIVTTGGAQTTLATVTTAGTFTSSYLTEPTAAGLTSPLGAAAAGAINFGLAGQNPDGTFAPGTGAQLWMMDFTGTFSGGATVTVHYDPTLIGGVSPSSLQIYHYTGGNWVPVANESINPLADTITFTTDGFSPFILGVPEPSTFVLAALGVACAGFATLRKKYRRD